MKLVTPVAVRVQPTAVKLDVVTAVTDEVPQTGIVAEQEAKVEDDTPLDTVTT